MSLLRLWEFVRALPMDSMTKCALMGDGSYRRWTETNYLLNRLLDVSMLQMQIIWAANGVSGKPPKGPLVRDPELRTAEQIDTEIERRARMEKFIRATRPGAGDSEYLSRLREIASSGQDTTPPAPLAGRGPVRVDPKQLSQSEMDQLLAFRAIREQATQVARQDKAAEEPRE